MKALPIYYDCGVCGLAHPWEWDGDCRDKRNRYTCAALDAMHGPEGYELLDMADRVRADQIERRRTH